MKSLLSKKQFVNIGDKFGGLEVIGALFRVRECGIIYHYAVCECECGKVVAIRAKALKVDYKSCGCLRGENIAKGVQAKKQIWFYVASQL